MSTSPPSTSGIGQFKIGGVSSGSKQRRLGNRLAFIAALFGEALSLTGGAHGQSVLSELTVAGDALFQGQAHFGTLLNGAGGPGFKVVVSQTPITVESQVWVEESTRPVTRWEDVWGATEQGYNNEVWGWVTQDTWHHAEGYYTEQGSGMYQGTSTYDEFGNEIMNEIMIQVWVETAPAYMTSSTDYVVTGTTWVSTGTTWGVIDTVPVTEDELVPGYWDTLTQNDYSAPIIDFTANRSSTVWRWQNPSEMAGNQTLMTLSSGGLSFPSLANDGWTRRSYINDLETRFSRIILSGADSSRQAFGSKQTHEGIQVWGEEGGVATEANPDRIAFPNLANNVKIEHDAVNVSRSIKQNGNITTKNTRVLADYAKFGGIVEVQGALRVAPSGDLSMGIYTQGNQP
jgi:hypothetical protein